jgi:hypothetical protein
MRNRLRPWALAAAVAALAGCAGIPTSGEVHVGQELPAVGGLGDVDVRVIPPGPLPGMSPSDVVHGFLRAVVNREGNYEIARAFLTRAAAANWHSSTAVTTYDDGGVRVVAAPARGAARTLTVVAPRIGLIDARGNFTPRAGTVRSSFQLVRQDGEWRIDRLPDGVLLSTLDAQRSFRLANVYYLNEAGTTLVPEQVLLPPAPRSATTALVRALLHGPGPWLAPAVHSAFPQGTDLLGNVPVDPDGVAEVNLSAAVRQAGAAQLTALSAQMVWTLRQVSEVTAVQLLSDGAPLGVPGAPLEQPRTAWASFDPAAPPTLTAAVFRSGGTWRGVSTAVAGLGPAAGLAAVAVSADGRRYAALRAGGRSTALMVGGMGERAHRVLIATAITPPAFGPDGTVYAVVTGGSHRRMVSISPDGAKTTVDVDRALLARPVQRIKLSRDGARVAAVVGRTGHGRLLIGRVSPARGRVRLESFRTVLRGFPDIRGLAWNGADSLLVTAADVGGGREIVALDVDGYGTRTVSTAGLPADPVGVAAAPGRPTVVQAGAGVWIDEAGGGWLRVGRGQQPTYAD